MDLGVENPSKINQKLMQKAIENKMQVGMGFGWLLEGFLADFCPKLAPKLEPSWHQNRTNWGTKTISKNHQFFEYTVVRDGHAVVGGPGP